MFVWSTCDFLYYPHTITNVDCRNAASPQWLMRHCSQAINFHPLLTVFLNESLTVAPNYIEVCRTEKQRSLDSLLYKTELSICACLHTHRSGHEGAAEPEYSSPRSEAWKYSHQETSSHWQDAGRCSQESVVPLSLYGSEVPVVRSLLFLFPYMEVRFLQCSSSFLIWK